MASAAVVALSGAHFTALLPSFSSTVSRARKLPLRFHNPRTGCLRLSRTLVYLWRREPELERCLLWVAWRFIWQHCRKNCRNVKFAVSFYSQVFGVKRGRCGEMADARDLKSRDGKTSCGFESRHRHHLN